MTSKCKDCGLERVIVEDGRCRACDTIRKKIEDKKHGSDEDKKRK